MTASLILSAPVKGWVAPLAEVPDPAFSGGMLGEGVAIEPTGDSLHAPFDGVVLTVAATRHAVALRADNGVEVLIHVGLETVALGGAGFELSVEAGQRVARGQRLGRFDLDLLARRARSLITPVLVTEAAGCGVSLLALDREVEVGEPLAELVGGGATAVGDAAAGFAELHRPLRLELPHGLHARPAGRLAQAAKGFAAEIALVVGARRANAKSPVSLLGLGLSSSQDVVLSARGPDAETALARLAQLLAEGLEHGAPAPERPPVTPPGKAAAPMRPGEVRGVTAAPGLAVGRAYRFVRAEPAVAEAGSGAAAETHALEAALKRVRSELAREAAAARGEPREILEAHLALLDDADLLAATRAPIAAGKSAGFAWDGVMRAQAAALLALDDARLKARAADLMDLRRRVLLALGGEAPAAFDVPADAIVLAEDLLPSEVMALIPKAAGFATALGGPTSHVAILCAGAGRPLLVAAGGAVLASPDGTPVILDAGQGFLLRDPPAAELAAARAELARRSAAKAEAAQRAGELCRTADGVRIEVFANLGQASEAAPAVAQGAEGCGLLRTEFLFLDRDTAPSEDEQAAAYQAVADGLGGRPLVIRTLDIGGDKPTPYLPLPVEDNPALGLRGVRTSLWRPELLQTQLRAILRVRPLGQCKIMVPMVVSLGELEAVRVLLDAARAELGVAERVELGVMVETPAAAATTAILARAADFFSIGTNDLTQYALAMDRGNPATAAELDALHPGVLRLMAMACEGAVEARRWIGVCGGLASDPLAAPLLVGLGVSELSAAPGVIPELKARVRGVSGQACRELARAALALGSAAEVRALLARAAAPMSELEAAS